MGELVDIVNQIDMPASEAKHLEALDCLMGLFAQVKLRLRQTLAEHGAAMPPPMSLRLLQLCVHHPGITPGGLADLTGRDKAQVTRMVKSLMDENYLERRNHPDDRRSHCLWPTRSAQTAVQVYARAQATVAAQLFGPCSPTEIDALIGQWTRLGQPAAPSAVCATARGDQSESATASGKS
jgi:MarR family transcriptional regulator, multiple antibiotic resistance protein MarR